jgi:hypothetical protein
LLLSDPSVMDLLACSSERMTNEGNLVILQHLLEEDERGVSCWMCFNCLKSLEQGVLPKDMLANLWIGDILLRL